MCDTLNYFKNSLKAGSVNNLIEHLQVTSEIQRLTETYDVCVIVEEIVVYFVLFPLFTLLLG